MFSKIVEHTAQLSEEKKLPLRPILMPIARLAAQKNQNTELQGLGNLIQKTHIEESMTRRPVLYWLLVNNPNSPPNDLVELFQTPESKRATLHYLDQDGHTALLEKHYEDLSEDNFTEENPAPEETQLIDKYAARGKHELVKKLAKQDKAQLFDKASLAYNQQDYIAFNSFLEACEAADEENFNQVMKDKNKGLMVKTFMVENCLLANN